jgi:hypothetical protein
VYYFVGTQSTQNMGSEDGNLVKSPFELYKTKIIYTVMLQIVSFQNSNPKAMNALCACVSTHCPN